MRTLHDVSGARIAAACDFVGTSRWPCDALRPDSVAVLGPALSEVRAEIQLIAQVQVLLAVLLRHVVTHMGMVQEWCDVLEAAGWPGLDSTGVNARERLQEFSAMLIRNDLLHVSHLEFADDPASWEGASRFSSRELAFVQHLGRKRKWDQRFGCVSLGPLLAGVPYGVFLQGRHPCGQQRFFPIRARWCWGCSVAHAVACAGPGWRF